MSRDTRQRDWRMATNGPPRISNGAAHISAPDTKDTLRAVLRRSDCGGVDRLHRARVLHIRPTQVAIPVDVLATVRTQEMQHAQRLRVEHSDHSGDSNLIADLYEVIRRDTTAREADRAAV